MDGNAQLTPYNGDMIEAFLELLREVESELVFTAPQERAKFVRIRESAKRIANADVPLGRTQSPPEALTIYARDLYKLCQLARIAYCPGSGHSGTHLDLSFMGSDPLRQVIESDHSTMLVQLKTEQYKAAVVFAGSVVEALLIFALRRIKSPAAPSTLAKGKPVDDWRLVDLLNAAKNESVITDTTYKAADAVRDSRNLIHPNRVVANNLSADRGLSTIAQGTVEKVCLEVADWCKRSP
jgi:hypothetical protein